MNFNHIVASIINIPIEEISDDICPSVVQNWTSLNHIKIITTVEDVYKIKFTLKEMKMLKNVGSFKNILKSKGVDDEYLS